MVGCFGLFAGLDRSGFGLSICIAAFLSVGTWFVTRAFARLWNRRFSPTAFHNLLITLAAFFALFFVIEFSALKYASLMAKGSIAAWRVQISSDSKWQNATFHDAYDAVKKLGVEDFTAASRDKSDTIPTTRDESKRVCAMIYGSSACQHFNASRPLLSKLINLPSSLPEHAVFEDIRLKQKTRPIYQVSDAIDLAANTIQLNLDSQSSRVVTDLRVVLLILFLFLESLPLAIIGHAAYKDLKVTT